MLNINISFDLDFDNISECSYPDIAQLIEELFINDNNIKVNNIKIHHCLKK